MKPLNHKLPLIPRRNSGAEAKFGKDSALQSRNSAGQKYVKNKASKAFKSKKEFGN